MSRLGTRWAVLPGLTVLLATCVSVSKSVLMDRSAFPVPKEEVYVFVDADEIPESCERVAILHASGDQDLTDEGEMLDKLREEAGKLGANAVQLQSMEEAGTGERIADALFETGADRDADAIALWCPNGPKGGPRE